MKELSIEIKARRYDEALNELQVMMELPTIKSNQSIGFDSIRHIFPELKESENEKIIKKLLALIEWSKNYAASGITADEAKEMMDWLEKQSKTIKVEEAMRDVEQKAKAFTEAHKGQTSDEILAQMRGEDWSEEDKQKLSRIYSILGQAADTHAFSTSCRLIGDKECVELQDFLKSLTHIPIEDIC